MSISLKDFCFSLLLFLIGSLVGFFILECGVRVAGYQPRVTTPPYFYSNHPRTAWTLTENFKDTLKTPDGVVEYRISSQGLRSDRVYENNQERKIFVIGDSYTFGIGVDLEDTFVEQWQKRLDQLGKDAQIVNLGVPGFGTRQSFERLKDYVDIVGTPSDVIYLMCNNDYRDNLYGKKVIVDGIRIDEKRNPKWLYAFAGHMYYKFRSIAL